MVNIFLYGLEAEPNWDEYRDFLNFYLDAPIDALLCVSEFELPGEFADQILHKRVVSLTDLVLDA